MDLTLLSVVLLIIYLEGILSIDNAAVLGAMVSELPPSEPIPWPQFLHFLAKPIDRLLGGQRSAALKVGLLGAYLGRALMLVIASFVIHNAWLKILGGLYLIKLAFENLGQAEVGEEAQVDLDRANKRGFWGIVLGVELADLVFSLDNVVAVVAISDDLRLVLFGVAMGIVTMRLAAGVFTRLIKKIPALEPAAYIVVLNVGIQLLLEEIFHITIDETATFAISGGTLLLAIIYDRVGILRVFQPVLHWLAEGMANINEIVDWILHPVYNLLRWFFKGIAHLIRQLIPSKSQP